MRKIQILIEMEVNEEILKKDKLKLHDLIENTIVGPDEFIDGFQITRARTLKGDLTSKFYYGQEAKVLDIKETEG